MEELVHISWWILDDSGSGTSPASHQKGTSESPTAPVLFGGGVFQWGVEGENYTVDRHGRSAVVMLAVIKCSFGGVLIRETRFLSQKNGFASWWADRKLIESSR